MTIAEAGPLPPSLAAHYPHGYAVVDVETSGLNARWDRVLQIAVVQVRSDGLVESTWSTLLDPGCDPGPVHIHGLSRERLKGAPLFGDVSAHIGALLAGRVLVAHNARFDWGFLSAEADREHVPLAVRQRLCTIALTRRLDVPLGGLSLASVAQYWGVEQRSAHDAVDDTRVLVEILRHSLSMADRLGLSLPLANCSSSEISKPAPAKSPRPPCPWRYPGRFTPGGSLRQGMKIVITGETATARDSLMRGATAAGLDVMNSVSSRTSATVCNDSESQTHKAISSRQHGTPVVSEGEFLALLVHVAPGAAKASDAEPAKAPSTQPKAVRALARTGPLASQRVLVIGGSHAEAAQIRERVAELGGQGAANLTASVTAVVCLPGSTEHPRWAKVLELQLPELDPSSLQPLIANPPQAQAPTFTDEKAAPAGGRHRAEPDGGWDAVVLPRGGVVDLPDEFPEWSLSVSWDAERQLDVDVVAFVVDEDEQISVDGDFCFYNNPVHDTGAVELDLDTPGDAVVALSPAKLPASQRRVVIAAAISAPVTFSDLGAIEMTLRTAEGQPAVRATLDAATTENTLVLANLYDRGGVWRFRAVGQGYSTGLPALAVLHGVDLED